MLTQSTSNAWPIPEIVTETFAPNTIPRHRSVQVNPGFTAFFQDNDAGSCCKQVANCLYTPTTIGSEAFLVGDVHAQRLAFLDVLTSGPEGAVAMVPYANILSQLANSCSKLKLRGREQSLVRELLPALYRPNKPSDERQSLKHVRFWLLNACVCFFLGESDCALFESSDVSATCDADAYNIRMLDSADGSQALEGWFDVPPLLTG